MKVLVTGGAGFMGSAMVRKLVKENHQVRVLDKLTYATGCSWDNLDGIEGIEKIQGDIGSMRDCVSATEGMEAVIHFAAESHVTRSEGEEATRFFFRVNVDGTRNILQASTLRRIPRVTYISTDEVYGPIETGYFKEGDKRWGDQQASSAYAKSKSKADDIAISYLGILPIAIVRPTNNFGPRQHPEKALPRWICRLLMGQKIPVWGKGEQIRDWLYVEDCCEAIYQLLSEGAEGVYNIGANNQPEITNRRMAEMLVEIYGVAYDRIEFVPDPRPAHDFRYSVNTDKIFDQGWSPRWSLKSALEVTLDWYAKNRPWWERRIGEAETLYVGEEMKDGD